MKLSLKHSSIRFNMTAYSQFKKRRNFNLEF